MVVIIAWFERYSEKYVIKRKVICGNIFFATFNLSLKFTNCFVSCPELSSSVSSLRGLGNVICNKRSLSRRAKRTKNNRGHGIVIMIVPRGDKHVHVVKPVDQIMYMAEF